MFIKIIETGFARKNNSSEMFDNNENVVKIEPSFTLVILTAILVILQFLQLACDVYYRHKRNLKKQYLRRAASEDGL